MGCSCSYENEIEEIIKNDTTRFKILITGLRKVGKTSLLQTAWSDSPEKISTKSCLCYTKKMLIQGTTAFIDIWDTNLVTSSYFVDMDVLILVLDLSNIVSFNVDMEKVKKFAKYIIVAGTKFDVSKPELFREAKNIAKQLQGYFVPLSVVTDFGIKDIWDLVIYLLSN
jgi:GTPase SAR1 family protein